MKPSVVWLVEAAGGDFGEYEAVIIDAFYDEAKAVALADARNRDSFAAHIQSLQALLPGYRAAAEEAPKNIAHRQRLAFVESRVAETFEEWLAKATEGKHRAYALSVRDAKEPG